jgi:hypothetical protein
MNNNKRISVAELDFDAIKQNIKNYMAGQTQFQDYDFEGSGLAILLDLLAYNTHYNGIYTNLAVNEMFLDSASKRSSVVSHAKSLGYTPQSATCARAKVNVAVSAPSNPPAVATLPSNQPFTTIVDNVSYTFYNSGAVTAGRNSEGVYLFEDIELIEGTPLTYTYTVNTGTRFIIPNQNVDISTLVVKVKETSGSDIFEIYSPTSDLITASETSKVYFIKEIDDGLYEVYFGNNLVGKKLDNGNAVVFEYFVSSLAAPNNASVFTYGGSNIVGTNVSVITTQVAINGSAPEDIDTIKYNAPRFYASQNRAVTPEDYKVLISKILPNVDTVMVWGGEDNTPKVYGKTFICIKPTDSERLTSAQKEFLLTALDKRNIVSITPELVDAEYLDIILETNVYYNDRETSKTISQLQTLVKQAVFDYDDAELGKFDGVLRFSKLVAAIDAADPSVVNNITKLLIARSVRAKFNSNAEYVINLINPIAKTVDGSLSSTGFLIPGSARVYYLDEDGKGNVRMYYLDSSQAKVIANPTIGTIDYAAGIINIKNLNIVALNESIFELRIVPASYDVVSALNQIVQVSRAELVVNMIADKTANGDLQAGYNYTFTSIT